MNIGRGLLSELRSIGGFCITTRKWHLLAAILLDGLLWWFYVRARVCSPGSDKPPVDPLVYMLWAFLTPQRGF